MAKWFMAWSTPVFLNRGPQDIKQGATGHWTKNPLFGLFWTWKFGEKSLRFEKTLFIYFWFSMKIQEENPSDLW